MEKAKTNSRELERYMLLNYEKDGYLDGCYAVPSEWLKDWVSFTKGDHRPGKLITSNLVDSKGLIKPGLRQIRDYRMLNKKQWEYLYSIYGGDPPLVCTSHDIYSLKKASSSFQKTNSIVTSMKGTGEIKNINVQDKRNQITTLSQRPKQNFPVDMNLKNSRFTSMPPVKSFQPAVTPKIPQQLYQETTSSVSSESRSPELIPAQRAIIKQEKNEIPPRPKSRSTLITDTIHLQKNPILGPKPSSEFKSKFNQLDDIQQSRPISVSRDRGVIGLENPMFYCYMNATLQCLLSVTPFCNFLKSITQRSDTPLSNAMSAFVKASENGGILRPNEIWRIFAISFPAGRQHDAPEFLRKLLDDLDRELGPKKRINSSSDPWRYYEDNHSKYLVEIFSGLFVSRVTCMKCNKNSDAFEPFTLLALELAPSLNQSLEHFTAKEKIKNQYKCESCKKVTDIDKQYKIVRNPAYLLIQLKRFVSNAYSPYPRKSNVECTFESVLDVSDYSNDRARYDLIAVGVHMGNTEGGHYYSFCKRGNYWYRFNDSIYTRVDLQEVLQSQAYFLFYEKRLI